MVESAWTTTAIAATCDLENTWGKGKMEIYTCTCMTSSSKRPESIEEESATLPALTVEGDCVLDFCLEPDSCYSGYCMTNTFFSVLINNGGPGWLCHKRTYAINKRPFPVKSFPTSMRNGVQP